MLTRFYADNFRCLANFELELDEANVFLGANGTGKTSVLEVLRKIQDLISRGRRIEQVFRHETLALAKIATLSGLALRHVSTTNSIAMS